MTRDGASCPAPPGKCGLAWIIGAFVICPCHLPLTLAVLAAVFSGTALGAMVSGHPWVAGSLITLVWAVATWYGFRRMREIQE